MVMRIYGNEINLEKMTYITVKDGKCYIQLMFELILLLFTQNTYIFRSNKKIPPHVH